MNKWTNKIRKARRIWHKSGFSGIKRSFSWKLTLALEKRDYQKWMRKVNALTDAKRADMRREIEGFKQRPLVSVVMPVYNVEERWLRLCIDSVTRQLYENWELCIADDCSPLPHIRRVLEEYAAQDNRIKVVFARKTVISPPLRIRRSNWQPANLLHCSTTTTN
jgi:cellulose synthase/poly-beta-1,6-N-acetylglucosamine synthase-like glycosyltransferase